jgi:branched-chain amino acid transport system substrate-binding protein
MTAISRRKALTSAAALAGWSGLAARVRAQQSIDIPVGALFPMSGPAAELGQNAEKALRTALEVVNGDYDLDLPLARADHLPNIRGGRLNLLIADHKGDPGVARVEAQRLIQSGKVVALIGAADERVTDVLSEIGDKAEIPFIDTDSSSLGLRGRPSRFTFRFAADEVVRANALFDFFEKLREDRIADVRRLTMMNDKEPDDVRAAQLLRAVAAKRGYSIADTAPLLRGNAKATAAEALRLRKESDILVVLGSTSDAEAYAALPGLGGAAAPVICIPTTITDRSRSHVSDAARGLLYINGFARDARDNDPNIAAINTLYRSFAKKDLDELTSLQFTGFLTLAFAINDSRNASPATIAQRLAAARFPGDRTIMPWDQLAFDASHQNVGARVVVAQRLDDRSSTVFPSRTPSLQIRWRV